MCNRNATHLAAHLSNVEQAERFNQAVLHLLKSL
jgi:hypothetical protein